jgi:hypothetical protein
MDRLFGYAGSVGIERLPLLGAISSGLEQRSREACELGLIGHVQLSLPRQEGFDRHGSPMGSA